MPKAMTLVEVQRTFENAGCILLSTTYSTSKAADLLYLCSCGTQTPHLTSLQSIQIGIRCPACHAARLRATMIARYGCHHPGLIPGNAETMYKGLCEHVDGKRHTLPDLREKYKTAGCQLLADVYVDIVTPMPFLCVCGRKRCNSYGSFLSGQRCSHPECIMERKRETCLERFGETSYSKTDECKAKTAATCMVKFGVPAALSAPSVRKKGQQTVMDHYGVEHAFQAPEVKAKIRATVKERYGVEFYCQTDAHKAAVVATCMERYGFPSSSCDEGVKAKNVQTCLDRYGTRHPSQDPVVAERMRLSHFCRKEFVMPSGTTLELQGYEPFGMATLLQYHDEADILHRKCDMPEVFYTCDDNDSGGRCGRYHRYYPDFYIPTSKMVVEVKSWYTFKADERELRAKGRAVKALGHRFSMLIYDKVGKLLWGDPQ